MMTGSTTTITRCFEEFSVKRKKKASFDELSGRRKKKAIKNFVF